MEGRKEGRKEEREKERKEFLGRYVVKKELYPERFSLSSGSWEVISKPMEFPREWNVFVIHSGPLGPQLIVYANKIIGSRLSSSDPN